MDKVLGVTVIKGIEQTPHVLSRLALRKNLVFLLYDLLEEWQSLHILHDQVDILGVVVGLVVFDDVGVVELVQGSDLVHKHLLLVLQLLLVNDFDGHLKSCVILVCGLEHFAKCSHSQQWCICIDVVVHFQLFDPLLLELLAK